MPRDIRVPVPTAKRMDEAPMDREELAAKQDGGRGPVVMGCAQYEFLCDEISFLGMK
jgi:hypothetical protein